MQSLQRCHWPLAVQSHHRVLSLVFKHVFAVYIFLLRVIIRAAAAAFHISLIMHHCQLLILWLDVAPSQMGANT